MGIFDVFKRKKRITDEEWNRTFFPDVSSNEEKMEPKMERERWDCRNKEERKDFIRHNCEKIIEAKRHYQEAKMEYGQVNAYLTDIQLIDAVEGERRKQLEDAARNIVTLTRERSEFMNRTAKITQEQYGRMEKYEDGMAKELEELKKSEEYGLKIRSDMNHLENEKTLLENEEKEITDKQYFLKQLSIITVMMILSLFLLFYVFHRIFKADMSIPYLLSIAFAAIVFFYIFYESQKNKKGMRLVEGKQNRAVRLLNKVKIKYVNNTAMLESKCSRLQVENSMELEYVWKQYLLAKEEEKKHRENTKKLMKNSEELVSMLRDFHVSDPEVWIYQATAILDRKEMVEVRHRLNQRRQKIRKKMEYNGTVREEGEKELTNLLKQMPEVKLEMMEALREFQIQLDVFE